MIPYGLHYIDKSDIDHVISVLKSDRITQGPLIESFEEALCECTGAKYAVAVSSGTAALHLAVLATEIKESEKAITSPISFVASANCVLYAGGVVDFADVFENSALINPKLIDEKIKSTTRIIIPVHYGGQSCNMEMISQIAKKHNICIIEDAAHAIGSEYMGEKIGSCKYSEMCIFSFHPVKTLTTGEGGAITTNDRVIYNKLCMLRSHGITKIKENWVEDGGPWYYEMQLLGFNYRMTDFQAALGLSQLEKLDKFIKRRFEIADYYRKKFENNPVIHCIEYNINSITAWHIFPLMVDFEELNINKIHFFQAMKEKGISLQVHYIPIYYHPFYRKNLGFKKGLCPNAERYFNKTFTIPLYPSMKDEEIEYVAECIISYFNDSIRKK